MRCDNDNDDILNKLLGLGDNSIHKSYYPSLQNKIIELETAENIFRNIFNNSFDTIIIHDFSGNILDVNDRMLTMYKCSRDAALQYNILDLAKEIIDENEIQDYRRRILEGLYVDICEVVKRPVDGSLFPADIAFSYINWYGKDAVQVRIRDMSEQKKIEEALKESKNELELVNSNLELIVKKRTRELEEANKLLKIEIAERKNTEKKLVRAKNEAEAANIAKGNFLANMSHEIRTPMNGIIGMTEIALMTENKEEIAEYLEIVKSSSISLLRVLNDILDYSKIEAGKDVMIETPFNLIKTTSEVFDLFNIAAKQKALSLDVNVDEKLSVDLVGDPIRFKQVLSNLVGNAIKFTATGGINIKIDGLEEKEDRIKIKVSVADTGIGIPDDKLKKLFIRFSQVEESFTRKYGGTGLGLAISKKLVEMMNGEIWVEKNEDIGSIFCFTAVFTKNNDDMSF